jgi:hypothetical protein
MDAIGERVGEIEDRLKDLTVSPADAPQKATAVLLFESNYDVLRDDDAFHGSAMLDAFRPFLTGLISEHAEYASAHPGDLLANMPFYSAA